MIKNIKKQVVLLAVLMVLIVSVLPVNSAAFTEETNEKASGLLSLQIANKMDYLETPPTANEIDISKVEGMPSENLATQMVVIYFTQEPGTSQIQELQDLGINVDEDSWIPAVEDHPNGYLLADMPIDKLDDLSSKDFVVKLDSGEGINKPHNDLAVIKTNVDDTWSLGYDGTGITIAVLDSGLDTTHPDIPTLAGSWDYAENDNTIGNTVTGHGTHVAGTVLGRGTQSGGQYKGVAPGADLVFLKIGNDSNARASDSVMITAFKDAVDVYNADIISCSYGGWDTYHDGSSATAQAVDYAYNQGAAVFCSAGNSANGDWHYSGTVGASSTTGYIKINVVNAGSNNIAIAYNLVWFDGTDNKDLDLEYYDSSYTLLTSIPSTQSESTRGTESVYSHYQNYIGSGDSTYYLKVKNNAASSQEFHIYYDSGYNLAGTGYVSFDSPDPFYTIGSPADADHAISVGSYNSRLSWSNYNGSSYWYGQNLDDISTFSSRGPRVDVGVPKPNIVAPGSAIISVRDQDVYTYPGSSDPFIIDNDGLNLDGSGPADYFVMQGTSMAAPHAAGIAALFLEAYPQLVGDPVALQNVLETNASNGGTHDDTNGYGLINASMAQSPTPTPTPPPLASSVPTSTPYSILVLIGLMMIVGIIVLRRKE